MSAFAVMRALKSEPGKGALRFVNILAAIKLREGWGTGHGSGFVESMQTAPRILGEFTGENASCQNCSGTLGRLSGSIGIQALAC